MLGGKTITVAALYINQSKKDAVQTAKILPHLAARLGLQLVSPQEVLINCLGLTRESPDNPPDFCLVLGGDGTMLAAAKHYAPLSVPLLGVNAGHLGFLTAVELKQIEEALTTVLAGRHQIDERTMLDVVIKRRGEVLGRYLALNELVVTRGTFARIVTVDIFISGQRADRYRADGVIVATPTGSTAYSLAAGGPVVHPEARVLTINPICPHALRHRSLVVKDSEMVQIQVVHAGGEVMLTVDGQVGYPLLAEDTVEGVRSRLSTKLIRMPDSNFFDVFRSRLGGQGEEDFR